MLAGVGVGLFTPDGDVGVGVGLCPRGGVGDGVLVGGGVGVGGGGVGVGVCVCVGVGVGVCVCVGVGHGFIGQGANVKDDAAKTGILLSNTQNELISSIHEAINTNSIVAPLLRLPILFDITNSFVMIKIHVHRPHPKICVFLTTNTSTAPALTIINSNR